jgi:hypothetical protein
MQNDLLHAMHWQCACFALSMRIIHRYSSVHIERAWARLDDLIT